MTIRRLVQFVSPALLATALTAGTVEAQICRGNPRSGGVAYEYGLVTGGSSHGASLALAGAHAAFGVSFSSITAGSNDSRLGGGLRYSFGFGDKLQVCPGLALGFVHGKWNLASDNSLTTSDLTGRIGISAGFDAAVTEDFALIPFAGVGYAETATYYDLKVADSKTNNTANYGGLGEAEYGITARYKRIYVGFASTHGFDGGAATGARVMLGFAF